MRELGAGAGVACCQEPANNQVRAKASNMTRRSKPTSKATWPTHLPSCGTALDCTCADAAAARTTHATSCCEPGDIARTRDLRAGAYAPVLGAGSRGGRALSPPCWRTAPRMIPFG